MTEREREILRVRRLIRDRHEFASVGVRGVWRYRNNTTMYTVRMADGAILFAWAESSGRWYETRQQHLGDLPPTLFIGRDAIRPDEGTTLVDYSVIQELWHDPSTPPEVAALVRVSP